MANPKIIGITGGIGAGKSNICTIFSCLGVPYYDSDKAAKQIVNTNQKVKREIKHFFGENSYLNGVYNAMYISGAVFSDKEKLGRLNAIIHPAVKDDFQSWCKAQKVDLVVRETALLFTTDIWESVDYSILVYAEEELRIKRTLARDPHRTIEGIKRIIGLQGDQEIFKGKADFVIYNNENQSVLSQVVEILKKIQS